MNTTAYFKVPKGNKNYTLNSLIFNIQIYVNNIKYVAPIYNDDTFFKAIATNAVLPVAISLVPGTVVACLGQGAVQLHIEGEVALHWRQAGLAYTVTWVC